MARREATERRLTAIVLAPMQGYADYAMRTRFALAGGFDQMVCEFASISVGCPGRAFWAKLMPEIDTALRCDGVPVFPQLLGRNAEAMKRALDSLIGFGFQAVDVNFGCPAPGVNRRGAGAAMLRSPEAMGDLVRALVDAAEGRCAIWAKMRLGWDDPADAAAIARALGAAGAARVTVHARTRADGYSRPARWECFAPARDALPPGVEFVANGDVYGVEDALSLVESASPDALMLGRGALADPRLAARIRAVLSGGSDPGPMGLAELADFLGGFFALESRRAAPRAALGRLKQWLSAMAPRNGEAESLLQAVRGLDEPERALGVLRAAARDN